MRPFLFLELGFNRLFGLLICSSLAGHLLGIGLAQHNDQLSEYSSNKRL